MVKKRAFLKNSVQVLCWFLIIAFLTNACTPPADQTKNPAQYSLTSNDFNVKQVVQPPEIDDPIDNLPYKTRNLDVVLMEASTNEPITITTKFSKPKNLSVKTDNFASIPVELPKYEAPEVNTDDLEVSIEEYKAFRIWHREFFQFSINKLKEAHLSVLREEREKFEAELVTLAKQDRKAFKKAFHDAQEVRRKEFKAGRQAIRAAYKEDRKDLKTKIRSLKQYFRQERKRQQGDFSTQWWLIPVAIGAIVVVGAIFFNWLDGLQKEEEKLPPKQKSTFGNDINNHLASNNLPEGITQTLAPGDVPQGYTYGEPEDESAKVKPEAEKVYHYPSNLINLKSPSAILASAQAAANSPFSTAGFKGVRALEILQNLKDIHGRPVLNFSPAQEQIIQDYERCKVNGLSNEASKLDPSCDYVGSLTFNYVDANKFKIQAAEVGAENILINGEPALQWLAVKNKNIDLFNDSPLVITADISHNNDSVYDWLYDMYRHFLVTQDMLLEDCNGDNAIDAGDLNCFADDNTRSLEWTKNLRKPRIVLKSPRLCDLEAQTSIEIPKLAAVTSRIPVKDFVFDGEYFFDLQFIYNEAAGYQSFINQASLGNLSKTLGVSSSDKFDAYLENPSTNAPPLSTTRVVDSKREKMELIIDNQTANLYDIRVEKVGRNTCNLYYEGSCVLSGQTVQQFSSFNMESGLYRVSTNYSVSKDENQRPVRGISFIEYERPYEAEVDPDFQGKPDPFGSYFVVNNGIYSTFARMNDIPEDLTLYGQLKEADIAPDLIGVDVGSTVNFHVDLAEQRIQSREKLDKSRIGSGYGTSEARHGESILNQARQELLNYNAALPHDFRTSVSQSKGDQVAIFHMFADLLKADENHFRNYNANPRPGNEYLNVGAVVSFTNSNSVFNKKLRDVATGGAAPNIPMLLQVINKSSKEKIAEWKFKARPGTHTFVQRYWDGQRRDLDTDTNLKQPNYAKDDYYIAVELDRTYLTEQVELAKSNSGYFAEMSLPYYGAQFLYPILSTPNHPTKFGVSTNVEVILGQGLTTQITSVGITNDDSLQIKGISSLSVEEAKKLAPDFGGYIIIRDYNTEAIELNDETHFTITIPDFAFSASAQEENKLTKANPILLQVYECALGVVECKNGIPVNQEPASSTHEVHPETMFNNSSNIRTDFRDQLEEARQFLESHKPSILYAKPNNLEEYRNATIDYLYKFYGILPRLVVEQTILAIRNAGNKDDIKELVVHMFELSFQDISDKERYEHRLIYSETGAKVLVLSLLEYYATSTNPLEHPYQFTAEVTLIASGTKLAPLTGKYSLILLAPVWNKVKPLFEPVSRGVSKSKNWFREFLFEKVCPRLGNLCNNAGRNAETLEDIASIGSYEGYLRDVFPDMEDSAINSIRVGLGRYANEILNRQTRWPAAKFTTGTLFETIRQQYRNIRAAINNGEDPILRMTTRRRNYVSDNDVRTLGEVLFESAEDLTEQAAIAGIKINPSSASLDFAEYSVTTIDFSAIPERLIDFIIARQPDKLNSSMFKVVDDQKKLNGIKFQGEEVDFLIADILAIDKYVELGILNIPENIVKGSQEHIDYYVEASKVLFDLRATKVNNVEKLAITWHHTEDLSTLNFVPRPIHAGKNKHIGGNAYKDMVENSNNNITKEAWERFIGKSDLEDYIFE